MDGSGPRGEATSGLARGFPLGGMGGRQVRGWLRELGTQRERECFARRRGWRWEYQESQCPRSTDGGIRWSLVFGLTPFCPGGVYVEKGAPAAVGPVGQWSATDFIELATYIAKAVDFTVAFVDDDIRTWRSGDGRRGGEVGNYLDGP